jgi:ABC-2 type transport system permease protein
MRSRTSRSTAGPPPEDFLVDDRIPPPRRSLRGYLRLYTHLARISLIRDMSYRLHFSLRCFTHGVWILLYLAFINTLLLHAHRIGDWDKYPYLLFQGTYLLLNSIVSALFVNNAADLADRIRSGDLDTALLQPVDEQFLLTCQRVDWAVLPQLFLGSALVVTAAGHLETPWTVLDAILYVLFLGVSVTILYSCVVVLASVAFWMASRETLFDLWFAVLEVLRVPSDVFQERSVLLPIRLGVFCAIPIIVAINVPARFGAHMLGDGVPIVLLGFMAVTSFTFSRWIFRRGLATYRSASS